MTQTMHINIKTTQHIITHKITTHNNISYHNTTSQNEVKEHKITKIITKYHKMSQLHNKHIKQ